MSGTPVLQPFYRGWAGHQRLLLAAIADLSKDQLALRTAPAEMSIWQIASHMAGGRAYWFHDVLGEGDPAVRDMFRVASTTVPNLPLEDAGWEDDESHPRTAAEIVDRSTRPGVSSRNASSVGRRTTSPSSSLGGADRSRRAGGWSGTSWSTRRTTEARSRSSSGPTDCPASTSSIPQCPPMSPESEIPNAWHRDCGSAEVDEYDHP